MKRLIVLLFCTCISSIYAQKYNFKNYTVEDGLAQSQINDINQDEQGYLWIGTESGLSRFNGLDFVNYSMLNGLPDNKVEKIYIEEDQTLWVGTPSGLAKLENNKFVPYLFSEPRRVNDIIRFKDQIYVATNDGLLRMTDDGYELIDPYREEPLYIRSLVTLDEKFLVCGTRTGIHQYVGERFMPFDNGKYDEFNISDLEIVGTSLYISTYRDGLIKHDLTHRSEHLSYDLNYNNIRSIYADEEVILCSTNRGATEIIGDQISYYTESNGLINQSLVCIFKDREDNIWMGTDGSGLLKFLGKSIISYSTNEGLSSNIVMSINQELDSSFIFGTYKEGLTRLDPDGNVQYLHDNNGLSNNTIWTTAVDKDGKLWIGTTDGVNCFDNGQSIAKDLTSQIESKIRSIEIIEDKYFFGGTDGLYVMSDGHILYLEHTTEINVNDMCAIEDDLYVGSKNGLYMLKGDNNYSTAVLIDIPESNINSITVDKRKNLWIGTVNGLFIRFEDNSIVPFELDRTDFQSRTIVGLLESSAGDIWVSTMSGVYQINSLSDSDLSYSINHFSTSEGLINLESNLNALYEDYDNMIWVGTAYGLARIDPKLNDVLFDFDVPELHFTGIRLFMEEFDYDRFKVEYGENEKVPNSINLPYDQNHLTFDFIGINLKDPESVQYEYRLKGASESWTPLAPAKYATYSDISPGDYDFEVRAYNKNFDHTETKSIHITIRPPFWKTWWFIISMSLLSFVIVFAIFSARIRSIKQKQENEKLSFKNRLLFLEQQSLNASMNRHFIFNSLNSIQYFINSSDKLSANKYLSSFAKLIRKNLDSSTNNNFIVTLQEEIDRIELYLTLEKMRFQEKFDYSLEVSSALDTEGTEIPSMILQPFVENSIIHGVLPLDRKGHIQIKIYEEYEEVVFEVIDDGIGIDNTLKNKKASIAGDHESKGMEITNRRIELLRKLTGENLLIIGPFQLNDENGESIGTKVVIKMQMQREQ